MVQTRGQTRKGAPPPAAVEPFSNAIRNNNINNPSRRTRIRRRVRNESEGNDADAPEENDPSGPAEPPYEDDYLQSATRKNKGGLPPAHKIVPTLIDACCAEPDILRDIVSYITGRDLHFLIRAIPAFHRPLRAQNAPRPLSCQDCPVAPMLKQQNPMNHNLLTFQQTPLPQPTPCTTPATSVIPLRQCEGHKYSYSGLDGVPDHGPDFWVCQYCVQKAWEAYSMFVKSRAIDLCWLCSTNYRRAFPSPAYPHLCTCVWDDKIWLCRNCRIAKATEDRYNGLYWVQSRPGFLAMHVPGPGTHVRDYINSESRHGESYCPCPLDVQDKIRSYRSLWDESAPPDFRPLVRLCIYCRKERFLTNSRFD